MSATRRVRGLWRRGQRGWPERFPLAQVPNPPLLLAMGSGVVAARTKGPVHTGARATFHVASSIWAWRELAGGANVVRRAVGAGALAYIAAQQGSALEGSLRRRAVAGRWPGPEKHA